MSMSQTSLRYAPSQLSRKHDHKCVCEICTCGGHKCPTQYNKYPDNLIKTTFQKDYIKFNVKPEESFKSKGKVNNYRYEPDQLKSQYQNEYQKFPITKEAPFKQSIDTVGSDLPFSKRSEYSKNYHQFPSSKRNPFKKSEPKKLEMPFMGRTTYRNDFNKWAKTPGLDKLDRTNYNNNDNPFLGRSTYNNDFQKWNTKPPKSVQIPSTTKNSPPLDGISMYKSHYNGFDPRIYERDFCPIDQLPPRPRQLSTGKNHLEFEANKMEWK